MFASSAALLLVLWVSPETLVSSLAGNLQDTRVIGAASLQSPSPPPDSLRNGAIIGAVVGGVAGALLASLGCAAGDILSTSPDDGCSAAIVGGVVGAGIGALIGIGIDALFEQAPYPGVGASGRRAGVRLRVRF